MPQPLPQQAAGKDCPGPGLRDADVVIWMGDFNYRLSASHEWAVSRAEIGAFSELLAVDQLRQEMGRGAVFHGLVCVRVCVCAAAGAVMRI